MGKASGTCLAQGQTSPVEHCPPLHGLPGPPATAEAICAHTLKALSNPAPQPAEHPHLPRPGGLPGEAASPSRITPSFTLLGHFLTHIPAFPSLSQSAYRGLAHSPPLTANPEARLCLLPSLTPRFP